MLELIVYKVGLSDFAEFQDIILWVVWCTMSIISLEYKIEAFQLIRSGLDMLPVNRSAFGIGQC